MFDEGVSNFLLPFFFAISSLIELPPEVGKKLIEAQVQIGIGVLRSNGIQATYDSLLFDEESGTLKVVGLNIKIPIREFCEPEAVYKDYHTNPNVWSYPCTSEFAIQSLKFYGINK